MKQINEQSQAETAKFNFGDMQTKLSEAQTQNEQLQNEIVKIKEASASQLQGDITELTKKLQSQQKESSQTVAHLTQEKEELTR